MFRKKLIITIISLIGILTLIYIKVDLSKNCKSFSHGEVNTVKRLNDTRSQGISPLISSRSTGKNGVSEEKAIALETISVIKRELRNVKIPDKVVKESVKLYTTFTIGCNFMISRDKFASYREKEAKEIVGIYRKIIEANGILGIRAGVEILKDLDIEDLIKDLIAEAFPQSLDHLEIIFETLTEKHDKETKFLLFDTINTTSENEEIIREFLCKPTNKQRLISLFENEKDDDLASAYLMFLTSVINEDNNLLKFFKDIIMSEIYSDKIKSPLVKVLPRANSKDAHLFLLNVIEDPGVSLYLKAEAISSLHATNKLDPALHQYEFYRLYPLLLSYVQKAYDKDISRDETQIIYDSMKVLSHPQNNQFLYTLMDIVRRGNDKIIKSLALICLENYAYNKDTVDFLFRNAFSPNENNSVRCWSVIVLSRSKRADLIPTLQELLKLDIPEDLRKYTNQAIENLNQYK